MTEPCIKSPECSHYEKAHKLCEDHSSHGRYYESDDDPKALLSDLDKNNVLEVQVLIREPQICAWDGICSLKFENRIDPVNIVVSDARGAKYNFHVRSIVSFVAKDD